jgi:putative tricarboxylic transport membrane protein
MSRFFWAGSAGDAPPSGGDSLFPSPEGLVVIEKALSAFFLFFSLTYLFFARDLTFGAMSAPKSGFLPILAGTGASVLAFINFLSVLGKAGNPADPKKVVRKMVLFCAGLGVYLVLFKYAGYLPASFAVLLFLLKISEAKGWLMPLTVSAGVAGGFYFTFVWVLGVTFP